LENQEATNIALLDTELIETTGRCNQV